MFTGINGQFNSDTKAEMDAVTFQMWGSICWCADTQQFYVWSGSAWVSIGPTSSRSFNNSPGRSIVSVAAAANGFQVSATRDAMISYSTTIQSTSNIASGQTGVIVLEVAPTNSSTASDWVEVGRTSNGQTLGLAVALQIVQPIGGALSCVLRAGYYARLRSISVTGTPTFTYNSGQEVLL